MSTVTVMQFESVVEKLTKAKVPCKVKLTREDRIIIECGWNYPDSMFNKIMDVTNDADLDICAEESGYSIIASRVIAGGPKRYFRSY